MAFIHLKFNVGSSFPTPDYPGNLAVFAPKLRRRVAASDTVQIRGNSREDASDTVQIRRDSREDAMAGCSNHPSIRGRIITIAHDRNEVCQRKIPSHPDIRLESSGPFIQLQSYVRINVHIM